MKRAPKVKNDSAWLYVERDDSEYDYKRGFGSFSAANEYRLECQRGWLNHCDYVWLVTPEGRHFNLTRMTSEQRSRILSFYNIPE